MITEYNIFLNGHGHYVVNASIYKLGGILEDLECEVEILKVKKFDQEAETYLPHNPSDKELELLEREVAYRFFNTLH